MCNKNLNSNVSHSIFVNEVEKLASEYGYHIQNVEDKNDEICIIFSGADTDAFPAMDDTKEDIPEELKEYLCVDFLETDCSSVIIRPNLH